ncbi:hypothetical protein F4818DRAFT_436458 [Hypoxylon cercidicola]|nr:hypothetical protein F4818DRAFT_436458 [Hypoxylon cercidicola]
MATTYYIIANRSSAAACSCHVVANCSSAAAYSCHVVVNRSSAMPYRSSLMDTLNMLNRRAGVNRRASVSTADVNPRAALSTIDTLDISPSVISQYFHIRPTSRPFSTSVRLNSPNAPNATRAASITDAEYHALSNTYLDALLTKYEELQDKDGDIDVEFSSGVMTIKVPGKGTYVINKQPPNKQIWLSSPVSGPKRYDYAILNGDTASGDWVYLRDGSTLSELLLEETGVVMDQPEVGSAE